MNTSIDIFNELGELAYHELATALWRDIVGAADEASVAAIASARSSFGDEAVDELRSDMAAMPVYSVGERVMHKAVGQAPATAYRVVEIDCTDALAWRQHPLDSDGNELDEIFSPAWSVIVEDEDGMRAFCHRQMLYPAAVSQR